MLSKVLFAAQGGTWKTPKELYTVLDAEFHFTLDPCPVEGWPDGLTRPWDGERVYCNPPYGRGIERWLMKAREADLAIYLLPARTDTKWWHDYALHADEIRFIRGRLHFDDAAAPAPFPSVILIYRHPS